MAKSRQTSQKNDREKKRKHKQKEKEEKREQRKKNSNKGKGLEHMIAYVDHNGQLSETPPDPKAKVEIKAEDILLGPQSFLRENTREPKSGRVAIYDPDRKYGFIKDGISQEKIFFHISGTMYDVQEGDAVNYELGSTPRGVNAIKITKRAANS